MPTHIPFDVVSCDLPSGHTVTDRIGRIHADYMTDIKVWFYSEEDQDQKEGHTLASIAWDTIEATRRTPSDAELSQYRIEHA